MNEARMMATATFTPRGHLYEDDGVSAPSVTQVIKLAGLEDLSKIPPHNLERARLRGEAVHQACQYLDEGDLDLESLDPQIMGYVLGYQRFKQETGFEPEKIEYRTIGELSGMKYGMCVDRVGKFAAEESILLDIKTASKPSPVWAIQTAAYAHGLSSFRDYRRLVVHVAKDGSYKLIPHNDDDDWQIWVAALRLAYWRLAHGVKLEKI